MDVLIGYLIGILAGIVVLLGYVAIKEIMERYF